MTEENVYLISNKYKDEIPKENLQEFVGYLRNTSDTCVDEVMEMPIKNRKKALGLTIGLGLFGADRFYIGDKKGGIVKIIMIAAAIILGIVGGILLANTIAWKTEIGTIEASIKAADAQTAAWSASIADWKGQIASGELTQGMLAQLEAQVAATTQQLEALSVEVEGMNSRLETIESNLVFGDTFSMIILLAAGVVLVIAIARWIMDMTSAISVVKAENYRILTSYIWENELKEEDVLAHYPSKL